jgi:AraC family transcriptional regulator of adaptative response / DNA-3-methyladenine glycosylase II
LRLNLRAPFDGDGLLAFYAARAVPGVEEVTDGAYVRAVRLAHGLGVLSLAPSSDHVEATLDLDDARDRDEAVRVARALFDLDAEPAAIAARLSEDPALAPVVRAAPGRRVPGAADGTELAVRALLGQQVSVAAARTHAARLVAAHGEPLARPRGAVTHAFPRAAALLDAEIGAPAARRRSFAALTAALAEDPSVVDDDERLLALPGIGPWTVSYIAMRVRHDTDAFMPTDLGVKRGLAALGLDAARAERWRPYRAYACMHLWAVAAAPQTSRGGPYRG